MTPNDPVTIISTAGNSYNDMWLSAGTTNTWITFDLGSQRVVSGFRLWNYNEDSLGPARSVKTAGIYAGSSLLSDGADYDTEAGANWGTLVENMTFEQSTGLGGYHGKSYFFASPVTSRYIQLYVTSSYTSAEGYTGISEIMLFTKSPPRGTLISIQ